MGTRSDIIVHLTNGQWSRIYCHWDGYLSHNGRILFDHYNSQKKAESLASLGDISSLGEIIGSKHNFDYASKLDRESPQHKKLRRMCNVYGRDRGEKDTAATTGDTLAAVWPSADTWTEFTYVWDNGRWYVADADKGSQTLIELGDALAGRVPVTPLIKTPFGITLGQHKPL